MSVSLDMGSPLPPATMDTQRHATYSYHYLCNKWYGHTTGVRNLHVSPDVPESSVREMALQQAQTLTGVSSPGGCRVELLQRFYVSIHLDKAYPSLIHQFPTTAADGLPTSRSE